HARRAAPSGISGADFVQPAVAGGCFNGLRAHRGLYCAFSLALGLSPCALGRQHQWHYALTIHSSRTRFAGRLNSGVRPMKFESLTGKKLLSIRLLSVGTHPAWVDSSSPQIATYAANLELADSTCVQVCPCEVPIAGKYPAL